MQGYIGGESTAGGASHGLDDIAGVQVRSMLRALVIPAPTARPVQIRNVIDSSAAIADTIGADLLADEPITCKLPDHPGQRISIYLAAHSTDEAPNERAAILLARLGLHDRAILAHLHGDLLITGVPGDSTDSDIPDAVLDALVHLDNVGY